jgi:long-chain acyl-CoA synthetase
MSDFLENIFAQLERSADRVVLREVRGDQFVSVTGRELLDQVQQFRGFLRDSGLQSGDRCGLLTANSIAWAIFDLALMAEGLIVVPLYSRQAPVEICAMLRDCQARLLLVGDQASGEAIAQAWTGDSASLPKCVVGSDILSAGPTNVSTPAAPNARSSGHIITIVYTSGTSGEPKGVCLSVENVSHMLSCTTERLNQLMGGATEPDRVFHYLPFNFAGSWILLLSCLTRESTLTLSTDLNRLVDEIALAAPNYFLNVPTLLERVRRGVYENLAKRPAAIRAVFERAVAAWERQYMGHGKFSDRVWVSIGQALIFGKIKERFGPHLRALICGSAPLAPETQRFFLMLGIPVLQVYGLTETTGICTMDDPGAPGEPGYVGPAISGIEMRAAKNEEIVVRGPNVFPGYWNRPQETERVLIDGWFHTGDQGEVNQRGNWRIIGRIKNLIILNSGHNVPPEPIEDKIAQHLPGVQQVVLVGNGRGYLCVLLTGPIDAALVQPALDAVNADLPHYRQIRRFTLLPDAFSVDGGLLTALGKLRRTPINTRFATEIDAMYAAKNT